MPGSEFLKADEEHIQRYLQYSRVKYGGLLDDWLTELELVVCACARCGHCWYRDQPSPEQLESMYGAGKPLFEDRLPSRLPTTQMVRTLRHLKRLAVRKTAPRFLDFGSGFGRWARAAADIGFDVHAYEPSKARGDEESPPFTLVHDLSELGSGKFDVVNIEQVLEHASDPLATLRAVRAVCSPEAIVRITVPNVLRSPEGKHLWDEWPFDGRRPHTMAPFEHLHGFTPCSLDFLVERAGFQHASTIRLAASHPSVVLRRTAGRLFPRLGQTLALVQPSENGC